MTCSLSKYYSPARYHGPRVPSTCRSFSLSLSAAQIVSSPFRSISKFPSRFQRWLDVLRPLVARISNREAALSFLFSLPFLSPLSPGLLALLLPFLPLRRVTLRHAVVNV